MANRKQALDAKRLENPKVDRINEELQNRGISKSELCKRMGTNDYSSVCKILNGMKPLTHKMLEKIAKGLKLPSQYFIEREVVKELKPKSRNGKPLMSDILEEVPELLKRCEEQDTTKLHDFFFSDPTRPLIATAHGGSFSPAVYASLLYGTHQGLGRAVTCYRCNSLSNATLQNAKILLLSQSMANIDIKHIAGRCIEQNPDYTCAVRVKGQNGEAYICKKLDDKCGCSLQYAEDVKDGFISIKGVFFYSAIIYKAFTKDGDFVRKLEFKPIPSENYAYSNAHGISSVPTLDKIKHFTVLYGSYAEPVAYNIESNIVEAGIASCMISDYRNYTHGRFLTEGNYIKNDVFPYTEAALICLVTPRENNIYKELLDVMPKHLPVITINTDHTTPLATLDLLYKANMFVSELGEKYYRTNPNDPSNYNGIDKRVPKNGVNFTADFNVYGTLDIDPKNNVNKQLKDINRGRKDKFETPRDLFEARNEILQKEQKRTEEARRNWSTAKPLTFDDFCFRTIHTYDTMKRECWSFNSKDDVRDGVSLQLGNMSNGFGVTILGKEFPNTEVPYQLAIFDNSERSIEIQKEIFNEDNGWLTNGLKMKRKFIKSGESGADDYWKYRRDTEFEKGKQLWCYEWMKFIIAEKVREKKNEDFRKILLSIPRNAIIIEQAQRRSDTQWGAWNEELLSERKIVTKAAEIENGVGKNAKAVKDVEYSVCNVGEWIGENAMGQILTMAKLALHDKVQMPIDEKILNDANINWFGKVLRFNKKADGKVTVKAVTRD